jgi:U3 small nucleolar RNA-associated protein 19
MTYGSILWRQSSQYVKRVYCNLLILARNILEDPAINHSDALFDNVLEVLNSIESVPESNEELEDFYVKAPKKKTHSVYSLVQHKKRAQGAWLALLSMPMNKEQRKAVLGLVADSIAPWFNKPELLMDFMSDCYDAGGSTSLLALSGVFYLIQEKNLDYPSFYRKLYSLLDSEILHSKHRSRFFRLLDTFLASTHLPAVLVASFVKRLARLTLYAPPSGIVAVVPWIYNLLRKHPTCTFMIHRETRTAGSKAVLEANGMTDPFIMDEEDPMETNAIESSLWEIVTLQSHYHPNVATLAKIISEQFTKHAYNLEDFLDHSYGSVRSPLLGASKMLINKHNRCLNQNCQRKSKKCQL